METNKQHSMGNLLKENRNRLNFLFRGQPQTIAAAITGLTREAELLEDRTDIFNFCPEDVVSQFALVSQRLADRVALKCDKEEVTYGELDLSSTIIAKAILSMSLNVEPVIGLRMKRTAGMIKSLLGILKARGCFVFFEQALPDEVVREMIAASDCSCIITDDEWTLSKVVTLRYDELISAGDRPNIELPTINPSDRAFIMFTSGSTNRMKGVVGEHRNLAARLCAGWLQFPYVQADACIFRKSLAFIGSLTELFDPLLQGIGVTIVEDQFVADPYAICELLRRSGISRFWTFPPLLRMVVDYCRDSDIQLPRLKICFSSGQSISSQLVQDFKRIFPHCRLINIYGSTEVTSDVAWDEILDPSGSNCIGLPMPGCHLYILDKDKNLLPHGLAGELWVGGGFVTRGYIDHQTTSEYYFNDCFDLSGRNKMFKTGDKAICGPDGKFVLLGRISEEIKVRGFRISLSQIDHVLSKLPGVKEAAAAIENPGDEINARLVGFLSLVAKSEWVPKDYYEQTRAVLPGYMVPTAFYRVDSFPKTPSGKLDRKELVKKTFNQINQTSANESLSAAEAEVAAIWKKYIPHSQVSANATFLELGGTSVQAFQVIADVKRILGIDISLREILGDLTVERLVMKWRNHYEGLGLDSSQICLARPQTLTQLEVECYRHFSKQKERVGTVRQRKSDFHTFEIKPSSTQRSLIVAQHLHATPSVYNIVYWLKLHGNLQVNRLRKALAYVVARHETLRTAFVIDGSKILQRVNKFSINPRLIDVTELSTGSEESRIMSLILEDHDLRFDLRVPPLARVTFVVREGRCVALGICASHTIADGWSGAVFMSEISRAYEGSVSEDSCDGSHGDFCFSHYCEETEKKWRNLGKSAAFEFWAGHFGRTLQLTELHFIDGDLMQKGTAINIQQVIRGAELRRLNDCVRRESTTRFVFLVSIYCILLWKYTGNPEILIGCPVANRQDPRTWGLIGPFTNTIVLRLPIVGSESFSDWLAGINGIIADALLYQDFPFELLVQYCRQRGIVESYDKLFSNGFAMQNFPRFDGGAAEFSAEGIVVPSPHSKFDLTLTTIEHEDRVEFLWTFDRSLCSELSAEQVARHFQALISAVSINPWTRLSSLEILSKKERERLSAVIKTTNMDPEGGLLNAFIGQAQKTPEKPAMLGDFKTISYAELDCLSDTVAVWLQQTGVGPNNNVVVLSELSVDIIPVMLGIWKVGATFVPISDSTPSERAAYMLSKLNPAACIGRMHSVLRCLLNGTPFLDWSTENTSKVNERFKTIQSAPHDCCAIIFTSGSAGQPKGVVLTYEGLENCLEWSKREFRVCEDDRVLLKANPSFDVFLWEALLPIRSGAAIVIPPTNAIGNSALLAETFNKHKVSIVQFVPSLLRRFLATCDDHVFSSVRVVVSGGEILDPTLAKQIIQRFQCELYNLYGPTEASVLISYFRVDGAALAEKTIPIGSAISNSQIYIVDQNNKICPPGVPGEMLIGGVAVAKGYLLEPELTARSFVKNPVLNEERLVYRTGDMAAMTTTGDILFLGRRDKQVKIRGVRVELGEIEKALMTENTISTSVVITLDGESLETVAFVVPKVGFNMDEDELKRKIAKTLPTAMIPSMIIVLDKVPTNKNGKVDAQALLGIAKEMRAANLRSNAAVATDAVVDGIISGRSIDLERSFLANGGDSLGAFQLASRLETKYVTPVSARDVLEAKTVGDLIAFVRARRL